MNRLPSRSLVFRRGFSPLCTALPSSRLAHQSLHIHRPFSVANALRNGPSASTVTGAAHAPPPATHTNSRHAPDASPADPDLIYQGPLSATYRRLKLFSLSSLALSSAISPFFFLVESSLPMTVRAVLVGITLGASTVPTALIAWVGKSYVTSIRRSPPPPPATKLEGAAGTDAETGGSVLELTTYNMLLSPRITRVYDPAFIADTERPFAKWELADMVQLPEEETKAGAVPSPGSEETVAETMDGKGSVLGRWIVKWEANGEGNCRGEGKIVRYFNIHEALMTTRVR